MGMKKYFFSETWKRNVMVRRRVRMMMRQSINPLTFFIIFGWVSMERVEVDFTKFPCLFYLL
jgi:hypothetical protein